MRLRLSSQSIIREQGKEKGNTSVTPKPKEMFKEEVTDPTLALEGKFGMDPVPKN